MTGRQEGSERAASDAATRVVLWMSDWWLRLAGLNLAGERRVRWLREWRAELWHAACDPVPAAAGRLVLHASGAWSDARAFRRFDAEPGETSAGSGGHWWHDLRIAARSLRRSPTFALMTVLTLAIAIGANVAMFHLIDTVLLRPLPYATADRLVTIRHPVPGYGPGRPWGMSVAGFYRVRDRSTTLDELGAYMVFSADVADVSGAGGGVEPPERIRAALVTAGMMRVLGARPALGRLLTAADDVPGERSVVVLSHDLWSSRFGADPDILGKGIMIAGRSLTVVGVMEPGLSLPDIRTDAWLSWGLDPSAPAVNSHYLAVIGLLHPGTTAATALAEVSGIVATFPEVFPGAYSRAWIESSGFHTAIEPLRDDIVGDSRRILWVLWASVGLVLLLAAANVANLFLVRTEGRRRDLALRAALGASRLALARHLLAESLLVTAVAGVLGLALGAFGLGPILAIFPDSLPRLRELGSGVTLPLVGVAAGLSVMLALILGLLPLVRFRHEALVRALASLGRGLSDDRSGRLATRILVGSQVAVALMLLVGAATSFFAFRRLARVDPGFRADGVVTFDVALPSVRYDTPEATAAFFGRLTERLAALPGVVTAGTTTALPLEGGVGCVATAVEGYVLRSGEPKPCPNNSYASPGYFEAMGIPVRAGHTFARTEFEHGGGVMIVNEALAQRFWPGESPVGKRVKPFTDRGPWYTIAGVVADVRSDGLDRPAPERIYFPLLAQDSAPGFFGLNSQAVVVRIDQAVGVPALLRTIPAIVHQVDPELAVANLRPMTAVVADSVARSTFMMTLLLLAAAVALLLGTVGLFGVVSYSVGRRRREMGVRLALGAQPGQVHRLVLRQALAMVLAGMVIGLVGIVVAGPAVRGMFYQAEVASVWTVVPVAVTLLVVAGLAAHIPARRAAATDPAECLRAEM